MSKQVLVETLLFTPTQVSLTEGKKTKNGNPLVTGILATVEVKMVMEDITQETYGREK